MASERDLGDLRCALADLWLILCRMDGRRREAKAAQCAFRRVERSAESLLIRDPRREVLLGPADIADARRRIQADDQD